MKLGDVFDAFGNLPKEFEIPVTAWVDGTDFPMVVTSVSRENGIVCEIDMSSLDNEENAA